MSRWLCKFTENMEAMFRDTTLPVGFILPSGFGSKATIMHTMFLDTMFPAGFSFSTATGFGSEATDMSSMFGYTTLTGVTFPAGFGSKVTDMRAMFQDAMLADLTFPAGFGSEATDMGNMFDNATLQGNLDWSQTTFVNIAGGINVNVMFQNCNFGSGFTIRVANSTVQAYFTAPNTNTTTANIIW